MTRNGLVALGKDTETYRRELNDPLAPLEESKREIDEHLANKGKLEADDDRKARIVTTSELGVTRGSSRGFDVPSGGYFASQDISFADEGRRLAGNTGPLTPMHLAYPGDL